MDTDLFRQFENGTLAHGEQRTDMRLCDWNPHKDFAGVFLKTIVPPNETNGLFTCHLVRIEPGHAIGMHTHPASIELHEVIKGSGVCQMDHGETSYTPGTVAIIDRDVPHEVRAGKDGLYLFAKFVRVPA